MKVAQKGKNMPVSEMIGEERWKPTKREGSNEWKREREEKREMARWVGRGGEKRGKYEMDREQGVDEWAAGRLFARSHLISKSANHTRM